MFRGLLYAQATGAMMVALLTAVALEPGALTAALLGGGINLLGYAWGGYQIWIRPGTGTPEQVLGRTVFAQVGKLAIFLVLFALTFRFEPRMHRPEMLGALLAGFLGAQLAGWIYLARSGKGDGTGDDAGNQDR